MKRKVALFATSIFCILSLISCRRYASESASVATVGDSKILVSDFKANFKKLHPSAQVKYVSLEGRRKFLSLLIQEKIRNLAATKAGYQVSSSNEDLMTISRSTTSASYQYATQVLIKLFSVEEQETFQYFKKNAARYKGGQNYSTARQQIEDYLIEEKVKHWFAEQKKIFPIEINQNVLNSIKL